MNAIEPFTYDAAPMRVLFGPGVVNEVRSESDRLGLRRVLVICSRSQKDVADRIAEALADSGAGVLAEARTHVPVDVAHRARDRARELDADGCVAVGGGSATGLGKAVALELGLPIIAVPTTYAGSEMSSTWGLTEHGVKRTGRDRRVLPVSVLYDPDLTVGVPASVSVTSGMNAIAHAVEGLYAVDGSPIVSLMAQEGIRAMAAALPAIVADPADIAARSAAQYGAWLCGTVLGAVSMALHHKLCHSLGGVLDLPHAQMHTVVLPHVLAFNAPAAPAAVAALCRALGVASDPAGELWLAAGRLGAPQSLRELGMAEGEIGRVAESADFSAVSNPRPAGPQDVTAILRAAWAGEQPAAAPAC